MIEAWLRWEPISGLAQEYKLTMIVNQPESYLLAMVSSINQHTLHITCPFVHASERTSQQRRDLIVQNLQKQQGVAFCQWTFFTVHNAVFLNWLDAESYTIWQLTAHLKQFSFITSTSIITVISACDPIFKIISDQSNIQIS